MRTGFRPRPLFLLGAAAALFAGLTCDDSQPVVRLPEKLAEAYCAHQFACCSPFEISAITSDRYTTQEQCLAFATIATREQLGTVDGSMVQGRLTVDPAALDACVKAYAESACGSTSYQYPTIQAAPDVLIMLAYCPDLFVGHVPDNSACDLPQECQHGSRCASGSPPSISVGTAGASGTISLTPTPGQCVPYQKAGEPCNTSLDCDPTAHLACRNFICDQPLREGEPCRVDIDPLTGQPISNCDGTAGLFCDTVGTLTCRHYPREGEPCQFFQPPPCDPDPALALSCNMVTGTCKKPGNEGDACNAPATPPCRADLACHITQSDGIGICASPPKLGEACTDRCASPNVCVFGVCTPAGTKRNGDTCAVNTECASLNCQNLIGSPACSTPLISPTCIGADVTFGNVSGFGGTKGTGFGGSLGAGGRAGSGFMTGFGGSIGSGTGNATGTGGGSGGAGGGPPLGCRISDIAPEDPIIADFSMGDAVPIGGIYTYAAGGNSMGAAPVATIENGVLHVTATTLGMADASQFWGAGIFFNGNPAGTDCIDATAHIGVQFDVSGFIGGAGCTAQYATDDSVHTNAAADPKGAGDASVWSPQAPFTVTASPMTVRMPFVGPGQPTGGNPAIQIDKQRLTGVQWQFTTPNDPTSSCDVDITIDNVRFF